CCDGHGGWQCDLFFFFQAEDGIRDRNVTGVQTCALPILLYMTATPIPRTLSITSYGDMDVSVIREMPKGRIPIETEWRRFKEIDYVLSFVKSEIDKGHSAYIVAPLIEESETLDLKNVYEIYEIFEEYFSPDDVVLVHGRMKAEEKNAA